ncbi:MAG: sugar phosphate isomerase/epimerase [Armatimonadetes bacterium]|nr:sugar phosphate isomerase/epimerase [Armatimonadota bacterium]
MKLAVFTDEVSQRPEEAVRLAVRYGLDAVELRSAWNKPVQHLTDAEVDHLRGLLDAHELATAALASPVFKCELEDEAARRDNLDYLRSCARIAKKLGTNIVRVFTFWKRGPSEPVWDTIKQRFAPALPIAEQEEVILAVENEHACYCATAAETGRLVAELDSPVVRVVWDPANEVHAEKGTTPFPDAYEFVKRFVVHVHVKDAVRNPKTNTPALTAVGEGQIDWPGQLRALLASDYQGYASLETHWRPAAVPGNGGASGEEGFRDLCQYATDRCLRNFLGLLAQARRNAA